MPRSDKAILIEMWKLYSRVIYCEIYGPTVMSEGKVSQWCRELKKTAVQTCKTWWCAEGPPVFKSNSVIQTSRRANRQRHGGTVASGKYVSQNCDGTVKTSQTSTESENRPCGIGFGGGKMRKNDLYKCKHIDNLIYSDARLNGAYFQTDKVRRRTGQTYCHGPRFPVYANVDFIFVCSTTLMI